MEQAAVDTLQNAAQSTAHTDLTGIALVVVAALLGGLGMERLKQPAILGYMVAGI